MLVFRFKAFHLAVLALALGLSACGDGSQTTDTDASLPAPAEETATGDIDTTADEREVPPAFAEVDLPENPTSEGLHDGADPGEDLYSRGLYREALEYWEVAAEDRGDAYAAYRLGVEYLDAKILERDISTSVRYQQLATELGSAPGMFELAGFYEAGIGVSPDIDRAAQLYLQSALRGFPPAQHNVATMFEDGVGLVQDPVRAYLFYTLARDQGFNVNFERPGNDEALLFSDPIGRLEQSMSAEDLAIAQQLVSSFEPIE